MTYDEFAQSFFKLESFMGIPKDDNGRVVRRRQKQEIFEALKDWGAAEFEGATKSIQLTTTYGKHFAPGDFYAARKASQASKVVSNNDTARRPGSCSICNGTLFVDCVDSKGRPCVKFCECHPMNKPDPVHGPGAEVKP